MNFYKLLLVFAGISCALTSHAQKKFHLGLKTGLNFSSFEAKHKPAYLYTNREDGGFYAGLFGEFRLKEHFSIQPEVFYIESRALPNEVREEVDQINVPLLAKLNIGGLSFFAGPQAAFLIRTVRETRMNDYNPVYEEAENSYQPLIWSGIAGLSYTFRFGLGFDARYQFGLGNAAKPNGETLLTQEDNSNVGINAIQAGLHFRFGKRHKKSN